jgi:hypothetical protein
MTEKRRYHARPAPSYPVLSLEPLPLTLLTLLTSMDPACKMQGIELARARNLGEDLRVAVAAQCEVRSRNIHEWTLTNGGDTELAESADQTSRLLFPLIIRAPRGAWAREEGPSAHIARAGEGPGLEAAFRVICGSLVRRPWVGELWNGMMCPEKRSAVLTHLRLLSTHRSRSRLGVEAALASATRRFERDYERLRAMRAEDSAAGRAVPMWIPMLDPPRIWHYTEGLRWPSDVLH